MSDEYPTLAGVPHYKIKGKSVPELKEEVRVLDAKLTKTTTQLNEADVETTDAKKELEEEKEKTTTLQAAETAMTVENEDLKEKVRVLNAQLTDSTTQLNAADDETTDAKNALKTCKDHYKALHETALKIREQYTKLTGDIDRHTATETQAPESTSNYDREEFIYKRSNLSF